MVQFLVLLIVDNPQVPALSNHLHLPVQYRIRSFLCLDVGVDIPKQSVNCRCDEFFTFRDLSSRLFQDNLEAIILIITADIGEDVGSVLMPNNKC
jgi:hypothetical protein